jgi:predicted MFS family arabinose efflux permease
MGVEAYIAYQAQGGLTATPQLLDPALAEQMAQRRTADRRDEYVAGVAALLALIGLGLGAWFGGMVSVQVGLLGAVLRAFVGAAAGILLAILTLRGS